MNVEDLERCWFSSPPWGFNYPMQVLPVLSKVLVKACNMSGTVVGILFEDTRVEYTVSLGDRSYYGQLNELELQEISQDTVIGYPIFEIGDRVNLRYSSEPKERIVIGVQFIDNDWFYCVEWESPKLEKESVDNKNLSLAYICAEDIECGESIHDIH
jgi:hypothetical protein